MFQIICIENVHYNMSYDNKIRIVHTYISPFVVISSMRLRQFFLSTLTNIYVYKYAQVPNGNPLNKGNIYIGRTSPRLVVEQYQEQFHSDFSHFLKLRFDELVPCGQMVLSFLGMSKRDILDGELSTIYGLVAESLDSMVREVLAKIL